MDIFLGRRSHAAFDYNWLPPPLAYMLINSIRVRNVEASWKPRGQDYKF